MKPNPNWPYLAGLVDGEGCLTLSRQIRHSPCNVPYTYRITINIAMTDERMMRWLVSEVGGVYYHRSSPKPPNKDSYCWHPTGQANCERFLLGILPYLIIKGEQAKLLLEFIRIGYKSKNYELRHEMWNRARKLNQRGVSLETNTPNIDGSVSSMMIESDLMGDHESAPLVTATA